MKKEMVACIIVVIFLISGCGTLKDLYGIQSNEEVYVPIEEIKVEGKENITSNVTEEIKEEEAEEPQIIEEE